MKLHRIAALPAAMLLLLLPSVSRAQSGVIASETPGVVILPSTLDSHKLSSGAMVMTDLTHSVKLPNGVELPKGTRLVATVASDDMNLTSNNKLVLRFTEARMKNGKTIPIKATILAVNTRPEPVENNPNTIEVVMPVPDNLRNQPDQIQEDDVTRNVSLRSNVTSANSGVFISDKNSIKIPSGSKMELAIAPASGNSGM